MTGSVYVIGSLRNREEVQRVSSALRKTGLFIEVFDDWLSPGEEADDMWKEYEMARGRTYSDALSGWAAKHVYEFDKYHLDRCDAAVLVMPAGKSCFLELGYTVGKGKPTAIVYPEGDSNDRWDVMFQFVDKVFFSTQEMVDGLPEAWQGRTLDCVSIIPESIGCTC